MNWLVLFSIFFLLGGFMVKNAIEVPNTYDELFKKHAREFGLNWLMLKRIAMIESSLGRAKSVRIGLADPTNIKDSASPDGFQSYGLMQVRISTALDMDPKATPEKLNNPDYTIWIAAKYFKWLQRYISQTDPRYEEWWIKSYNQGPGAMLKEKAGTIQGKAHDYWAKYSRYKKEIVA